MSDESSFDEAVASDGRPARTHVLNALNSIEFALRKCDGEDSAKLGSVKAALSQWLIRDGWIVLYAKCRACGHFWIAVAPIEVDLFTLQCSECNEQDSEAVEI